jgi:hypothetical protein
MRWRLYIEEYSPDLCYIEGTKNVAADALSLLGILNNPMNEAHFTPLKHFVPSCTRSMMRICPQQLFLSLMHF